jgi:hypothetical protein
MSKHYLNIGVVVYHLSSHAPHNVRFGKKSLSFSIHHLPMSKHYLNIGVVVYHLSSHAPHNVKISYLLHFFLPTNLSSISFGGKSLFVHFFAHPKKRTKERSAPCFRLIRLTALPSSGFIRE